MKTIRQLTLTVITALFVVTVALLWASASPKVSGKSQLPFTFAPRTPTGLAAYAAALTPWTVYFKRHGEDMIPGFSVGFRPEFIRCGRSGWRWRPRYFGRRQLFWFAGHFCFEKQRRPNFCRAGLLPGASARSSRRSGSCGFRFRWRSRRVCNHPRQFRSNDEDQGVAQ